MDKGQRYRFAFFIDTKSICTLHTDVIKKPLYLRIYIEVF